MAFEIVGIYSVIDRIDSEVKNNKQECEEPSLQLIQELEESLAPIYSQITAQSY